MSMRRWWVAEGSGSSGVDAAVAIFFFLFLFLYSCFGVVIASVQYSTGEAEFMWRERN
jgi:hypothetical protein